MYLKTQGAQLAEPGTIRPCVDLKQVGKQKHTSTYLYPFILPQRRLIHEIDLTLSTTQFHLCYYIVPQHTSKYIKMSTTKRGPIYMKLIKEQVVHSLCDTFVFFQHCNKRITTFVLLFAMFLCWRTNYLKAISLHIDPLDLRDESLNLWTLNQADPYPFGCAFCHFHAWARLWPRSVYWAVQLRSL